MFASKSAILVSLFALSSSVLATPPACLLAAVNQQQNPADLSSVCGANGHQVQQAIASICGSNVAVAESAFAATCSSAGHTVGKPHIQPITLTWAANVRTNSFPLSFVHSLLQAHKLWHLRLHDPELRLRLFLYQNVCHIRDWCCCSIWLRLDRLSRPSYWYCILDCHGKRRR